MQNNNINTLTEWAINETKNNGWYEKNNYRHFLSNATREEFLTTQIPFFHAVKAFPRALAKLAYLIEESSVRLAVIENLYEEHGSGDLGKFHVETFQQFLRALNWDGIHIINPNIEAWIKNLLNSDISAAEYAAYLSGIEYAYATISHDIENKLNTLELICPQIHYDLHAALDWDHGNDLLEIAVTLMNTQDYLEVDQIKEVFNKAQAEFLEMYSQMVIPFFNNFVKIGQENVSFYYTREDSNVEIKVLNTLYDKNVYDILTICSGGEHIIHYLSQDKPVNIVAIDMNPHAIELCQNKIQSLLNGNSPFLIQDIGKFEKLFLLFREKLQQKDIDFNNIDTQAEDLIKYSVAQYFNNDVLATIFGKEATMYSKADFATHFAKIYISYLQNPEIPNAKNILYGQPLYDLTSFQSFTENYSKHKLEFTHNNFNSINLDRQFDLIDISNIGDWMNIKQFQQLLKLLYVHLNPNSCLIGRRLLGNYNLVNELANAGFHTQTESDSTLFYSETIVGRKQ